jgi:hypothetical protein
LRAKHPQNGWLADGTRGASRRHRDAPRADVRPAPGYSAVSRAISVLDVADASVPSPLGFEPSPPSSKPGALPARRRGNVLEPRAGFEPALCVLKERCPRPLDERGEIGAGSEKRTRVFCLESGGSGCDPPSLMVRAPSGRTARNRRKVSAAHERPGRANKRRPRRDVQPLSGVSPAPGKASQRAGISNVRRTPSGACTMSTVPPSSYGIRCRITLVP